MKVKIVGKTGDVVTFDSSEVLIMLKLDNSEKTMLREMPEDCAIFSSFPDILGSENQKLKDIETKMEDFNANEGAI